MENKEHIDYTKEIVQKLHGCENQINSVSYKNQNCEKYGQVLLLFKLFKRSTSTWKYLRTEDSVLIGIINP